MISRTDWLSFTFTFTMHKLPYTDEPIGMSALVSLESILGEDMIDHIFSPGYEPCNGRPPYRDGIRAIDGGATLYFNPTLPHALCEVSGRGCERLHAVDKLNELIRVTCDNVTRIDLACDWLSDVKPSDFAENRANGRFKAFGQQVSDSGETYYVGSKASDRYARVYRYNPPHPRHEFLRCEMVFRRNQAKICARAVWSQGLHLTIQQAGKIYDWAHPLWQSLDVQVGELEAWRPERHDGKTMRWLITQVAPSIRRLMNEGDFDLAEWLERWVLEHVDPHYRQALIQSLSLEQERPF